MPDCTAGWSLWHDHRIFIPHAAIQKWPEAEGEKLFVPIAMITTAPRLVIAFGLLRNERSNYQAGVSVVRSDHKVLLAVIVPIDDRCEGP